MNRDGFYIEVDLLENVILSFKEKRREKQIQYERKVLKEITPKLLKERVATFLFNQHTLGITFSQVLEEGCYDVAIESFLLGANFSKFGFYGESEEDVKARCFNEEKHLIDTLFNFILYWGKISDYDMYNDSLYYKCEQYVNCWWKDGFMKGAKRYKLRLH